MVRRISISVLSILALAVVASASGYREAKAVRVKSPAVKEEMSFTGDVEAVDLNAHTFTVRAKENGTVREMVFHVGDDSRVMIDGEQMLLDNIERGDHVTVEYRSSAGTHTATTVKRHKKTR